jgi:hypothetical protein
MADHSLPTTTSTYTNFVTELDGRMDDLAVGLDPAVTTATNIPPNTIRWNAAVSKWQKWSGTVWNDLAPSFNISVLGNAGTATTLQTPRAINSVSFNGSANVVVEPFVESDEATNATRYVVFVDSTVDGYQRLNEDSSLTYNPATNTLTTTNFAGALSGNATTATTLQTARTINGVSFNGSANINVNTVNQVTFNNSGSGAASGSTFNGGSAFTVSYNTVGAPSATGANASGSWAIDITGNANTATQASNADKLDNFDSTAFVRSVSGVAPDGSGNVFVDLDSRVAKTGDTMTGNLTISNTAPTINLVDTNNVTRKLHVNDALMGFLNSADGWDFYANNAGQLWTSNYGWLHNNFFNTVLNCSAAPVNCYGTGNITQPMSELIDNGGQLQIRRVNFLINCNCACSADCF